MKNILLFFLSIVIVFYSCNDDSNPTNPTDNNPYSGNITTENFTEEISKNVGPNGGKVIISNSESVINGMEIIIPENGYGESRNYTVSTATIKDHKFGEYFNPVTPIITIKNGGGYSEMPISVKIPINVNNNEFLMGFLYNEISGKLEALPVIELNDSYIIVETRHFDLSNITTSKSLEKSSDLISLGNLVISSIEESVLSGQTIISTGFTPGIDDWEFINFGSHISPGGHCAGQSITAMWYYYEKKLSGEAGLFHNFDKVNDSEKPQLLWEDNPSGYRLASSVQEDAVWKSWWSNIQTNIADDLVWKTFITSMLITGNPQFVGIRNTNVGGGHALVAYKIDVTGGKLYVADPNYPGNRALNGASSIRIIDYHNNVFLPYPSFAKAGDPGKEYDQIRFYATNTFFNWEKVGERYNEFESKTIGNDRFPEYTLYTKTSGSDISITDGMTVTSETIELYCHIPSINYYFGDLNGTQYFKVYDSAGNLLAVPSSNGIASLKLNLGENKLGIYVSAATKESVDKFCDFKEVTIFYEGEDLNGMPCPGIATVTYEGIIYNTVQIGNQCWIKENLDVGKMLIYDTKTNTFEKANDNGIIEKYCYKNDEDNCDKYGGLYEWKELMQYNETEGSKGICPNGWHIPTKEEFSTLNSYVNSESNRLKAIGEGSGNGAGTNTSGFSALLSGSKHPYNTDSDNSYFLSLNQNAYFWTSSKPNGVPAIMYLDDFQNIILFSEGESTKEGLSVRCILDEGTSNKPPQVPSNPNPQNGVTDILITTSLSWSCSDPEEDPITFDIYLGETSNPPLIESDQTNETFNPGILKKGTKYYWKVVAKDNQGNSISSPVWEFTTTDGGESFGEPCPDIPTVTYSGKTYNTVKIGDQCWLRENLNLGTLIAQDVESINNGTIEKYCYDNDEANCETYGGLYQWEEAMQYVTTEAAQGICPDGWHIPTFNEFLTLKNEVKGESNSLKAIGEGYGSYAGTNISGFSAILAGHRKLYNGGFENLTFSTFMWSSTQVSDTKAYQQYLFFNTNYIDYSDDNKGYGYSIRCLKD